MEASSIHSLRRAVFQPLELYCIETLSFSNLWKICWVQGSPASKDWKLPAVGAFVVAGEGKLMAKFVHAALAGRADKTAGWDVEGATVFV